MKNSKRILSVLLVVAMLACVITVFPANAENSIDNNREVIAAFNFDNTGKISGEAVAENYIEAGEPKFIDGMDRTNYYTSTIGTAYLFQRSLLKWSDKSYFDADNNEIGILPENFMIEFSASIEGYQYTELSFDMGVNTDDGEEAELEIHCYNNDYSRIPEWTPFKVECSDRIKHYTFSFKSREIEDYRGLYNELIFMIYCKNAYFAINNIVLTGVKYDTENERSAVYGDADDDLAITINDATVLQKYEVGIGEEYFLTYHPYRICDVNSDGRISILDVTCIQKYLAGYTDSGRTGEDILYSYY